jgi:hypothetical protein
MLPTVTSLITSPRSNGWLTFESLTERRKLSPVPTDWSSASATRLEELCATAERVRSSGPHRVVEMD